MSESGVWRLVLARWLRAFADRIDRRGAPKAMGYTFTFESHEGVRFRTDGRGCQLWYLGDATYQQAHDESDTAHKQIDWTSMTSRTVGGRS